MTIKGDALMSDRLDLIQVVLYSWVSSDRQDVGLSVAAQLRALRDYAERNGHMVTCEYLDGAESGRIADGPQFRNILNEVSKSEALQRDIRLEVVSLHPQAGERRSFSVHAEAQGHPRRLHRRAGKRQPRKNLEAIIESVDEFYGENLILVVQ